MTVEVAMERAKPGLHSCEQREGHDPAPADSSLLLARIMSRVFVALHSFPQQSSQCRDSTEDWGRPALVKLEVVSTTTTNSMHAPAPGRAIDVYGVQ